MIFKDSDDIAKYIANSFRDLYNELNQNVMKKEYMKKRVEDWCSSHNCHLEVFSTGVYCLCYHEGLIDTEFFSSLTKLYNYLFVDSEE